MAPALRRIGPRRAAAHAARLADADLLHPRRRAGRCTVPVCSNRCAGWRLRRRAGGPKARPSSPAPPVGAVYAQERITSYQPPPVPGTAPDPRTASPPATDAAARQGSPARANAPDRSGRQILSTFEGRNDAPLLHLWTCPFFVRRPKILAKRTLYSPKSDKRKRRKKLNSG